MAKATAEKVTVKLPRANRGEDNFVLVSVNGAAPTKIKRGVSVEVSPEIAEVLEHSFAAQDYAEDTIEAEVKKAEAAALAQA